MANLLVYNIEPATPSMISSLDRHCRERVSDGTSAIDTARSHLNQILVGEKEGLSKTLRKFYEGGIKPPAKQAESPYLRIVVSASASYFRPDDPDAAGTWMLNQLKAWQDAVMPHLRAEHGGDLIYAELHLDEDTPHIHAVVVPTYSKKPRIPGRKKRGETDEEFAARKVAAQTATGVRVVGRASHPVLSKRGSFQRLRESMAVALDHLGIEYGEDRGGRAEAQTTRQWVKDQAAEVRKRQAVLAARQAAILDYETDLANRQVQLNDLSSALHDREAAVKVSEINVILHQAHLSDQEEALLEREINLASREAVVAARLMEIDLKESSILSRLEVIHNQQSAIMMRDKQLTHREAELNSISSEIGEQAEELSKQRTKLDIYQQQILDKKERLDRAEVLLSEQEKKFGIALEKLQNRYAQLNKKEVAIHERDKALDLMLRGAHSLIHRIGALVKIWSQGFGLAAPQELKKFTEIQAALTEIEAHNFKSLAAKDTVADPSCQPLEDQCDDNLGSPGF